ncbi:MAG: HTH domain-containing protein, partial [Lachnospiraceae bacterium]|nr:HTH domain-containing protein [Lachnospiraceae bacterium]
MRHQRDRVDGTTEETEGEGVSREKVYEALAERPGAFLSGEELSRRLGISRAAVWKAVEGLRRQ